MTSIHLNGHHRKTLASIFSHPEAHNVEWHDVLSLLNYLGTANEGHNGSYDIAIGDEHLVLGRPHGHDLQGDDLRHLRAFLTKAGISASDGSEQAPAQGVERHCIVVIDHHQARLFGLGNEAGDVSTPRLITPEDPDGALRRIEHKQGNDDHDGGHAPEEAAYYERVSQDLKAAHHIVVFSDGKGRSCAGAYLLDYLKRHHPAIAGRVVAHERIDISHISDGEILETGHALLMAV